MQKTLMASAAAIALGAASISGFSPAFAAGGAAKADMKASAETDCTARLAAYDRQMIDDTETRTQIGAGDRRNLRELQDAAVLLSMYGETEACKEVVAAIEEIVANPEARRDRIDMAQDGYAERAKMRAEAATPLDKMPNTTAAKLIGSDLHNFKGDDLGSVDDLVVGQGGKMSYLIVAHGGFLGMGEKQIAVPFDSAKISEDGDTVYIQATDASLDKAPAFDRDDRSWMQSTEWRQKNDAFFNNLN